MVPKSIVSAGGCNDDRIGFFLCAGPTVALRITKNIQVLNDHHREVVFRVDGQLRGEEVGQLREACRVEDVPIVLELADLQWVDGAGARFLRKLIAQGARVRGISPYVELLLQNE